ncbi:MAG: transcription antitermination factor NusB [Deltaproteobacteria bacterium]|nr:transcription antitermination factor NusB [Deltaproteobacteria bacterium]
MGVRRRSREAALKVLYSREVGKHDAEEALDLYWTFYEEPGDGREFTERLVRGTIEHLDEIDLAIQAVSTHWKINRMACVDRNLLRMAAYELFHEPEVPKRVTLNEAIEIAKRYGAEDSWAFINGILDKLAEEIPS